MPTPATMTPGGTAGGTAQKGGPNQSAPPVATPFIRATQLHRESAGIDITRVLTTATQDLGAFSIPAYGYLRSVVLLVQGTGGAGTAVTATEDAPWNVLQNVLFQEPNGATIQQFNSGYDLFLVNKYGGYRFMNDPKASPVYSLAVGTAANFSFLVRIPVELNLRDALGALPNQNAAAPFQLRLSLAPIATVFGGTVSTAPSVRIRAYAEEFDQPELSTEGVVNQTTPPAMNTTQYWSVQQYPVNAGNMSIRLTRMGNFVRNLIFIFRTAAGSRSGADASFPDPATLYWDTRPVDLIERNAWLQQIYERYGYGAVIGSGATAAESPQGRDLGVFPYDFCHEFQGKVGNENRDLWLPTIGSTRLELGGTWGVAGTLYVLTNDVSIAGNVFL